MADILRNIAFDIPENQDIPAILVAIKHYQAKTGNVAKEAPDSFLSEKEQAALYSSEGKFRVSLREADYVADGLLHNLSIKSTIHSTDTHGYSEAIFGILNMLGIYFAPRIKGLKKSTLFQKYL
nr:Tn3 family transposase [Legionella qingyii]